MDKLLTFPGKTDKGIFTYVLDTEHSHLIKTAAEYHPAIAAYIANAKPIPGKTQALLTALGAGEWWGNNVNGDYFPEASLAHYGDDYGYYTFQKYAKIYKHHINKNPLAAYGEVPLSVYNPNYHRVELIVSIDNEKAPDLAEKMENGDYPEWSMGCRVPYDICSHCGHRAPTRKEYCDDLRYYMGRLHPATGKMVYAINTLPKFFDISVVLIGADKIAKTLRKVAHSTAAYEVIGSAYAAEKIAVFKAAEMEKEVPAAEPPASQESVEALIRAIPEVKAKEKPFPPELLDRLASFKLPEVFSTMMAMRILPKPQEFQRILLVSIGKKDMADELDSKNLSFDPASVPEPDAAHTRLLPISDQHFSPAIMDLLSPYMDERSYALPHLAKRIVIMVKSADQKEYVPKFLTKEAAEEERVPLPMWKIMGLTAGLYAVLSHNAPMETAGRLDKLIRNNPGLFIALTGAVPFIFNQLAGKSVKGQYDVAPTQRPDVSNISNRIEEQQSNPILKVGSPINAFFHRAIVGIPTVYMTSTLLQKNHQADPTQQEGLVKRTIRRYPDLISGALLADATLALFGKGTHGYKEKLLGQFKGASESDPIALSEQATVEASKKLLSKGSKKNKIKTTDQEI